MPPVGKALIVDGLDEVTVGINGSALDEVLSKLSLLDNPPCILSCRAADWEGATARHKIAQEYGRQPIVLQLQPFSLDDAETFISAKLSPERAKEFLKAIAERGLSDLIGNPLTLKLLTEVAASGKELPTSRSALFHDACLLLLDDRNNPYHQRLGAAKFPSDTLLDAGGAVFAHLLLIQQCRRGEDEPRGILPQAMSLTAISSI